MYYTDVTYDLIYLFYLYCAENPLEIICKYEKGVGNSYLFDIIYAKEITMPIIIN